MTALNHSMCIDKALLIALCYTGQISTATDTDFFIAKEIRSLQRLRHQMTNTSQTLSPKQTYLNLYDRLFRHITLALLNQGYQLTSQQPHQSLRRITRQSLPDNQVQRMITHRHLHKKTVNSPLCKISAATLTQLLGDYDIQDSQACQKLYQTD